MVRTLLAVLLLLGLVAGCGGSADPSATSSKTGGGSDATSSSQEDAADITATVDAKPWLPVPKELSGELAESYKALLEIASEDDTTSLANIGFMSHQVALALAKGGATEEAQPYLIQAGKTMRAALDGGIDGVPKNLLQDIFTYEAGTLALTGENQAAVRAIDDAVKNGLTDLDFFLEDEELDALRNTPEFIEHVEGWKKSTAEAKIAAIALEKATKEAAHQALIAKLTNGESIPSAFPLAFTQTDLDGNEINLESYKGKVVIVDFWGTWCPPCKAEIPSFIKLQDKYGEDGFQVIGLTYERGPSEDDNLAVVTKYVEKNGINYPCCLASPDVQAQVPNFKFFPTTLFIDKTGKVRYMAEGLHDYESLESVVEVLMAE